MAGTAIPAGLALDFAVPITFIALVAPALRSLPHLAAAVVSVVVALALAWMPYSLWLMVAALARDARPAPAVERWQERRAMSETARIWAVILVLGLGTFLIRFSFIGLVGDRALPRLGDAPAALRAGGGDARPRRAAGRLAARRPAARPTRRG